MDLFTAWGVPHGYCIAWRPEILWPMIATNAIVGLSYYSIPLALLYFRRRNPTLKFGWLTGLFGAFIFACGTTHFVNILLIWQPLYQLDLLIMTVTAIVSVTTAIVVWPLAPRITAFLRAREDDRVKVLQSNSQLENLVGELESKTRELEQSERRFRMTLEHSPIGLAMVDVDGRFANVNAALCAITGYTAEELCQRNFQSITHPDDLAADLNNVLELLAGKMAHYTMEKRYVHKNGSLVDVRLDVGLLRDGDGRPLHFVAQIQDISERKALELELRKQARTDSLTQLPNRRHFIEMAEKELARAARSGRPFSLLMLDLDHFKQLNDSRGHEAGDAALREVGRTLRTVLRPGDIAGRLGGEEFAIAVPDADENAARRLAARLLRAIAGSDARDKGAELRITASIGLASTNDGSGLLDDLLKKADLWMYQAKAAGRNRLMPEVGVPAA